MSDLTRVLADGSFRDEDEPCERGTVGCSVKHVTDTDCETW